MDKVARTFTATILTVMTLGRRLVTNIIPDITYKYMYGQNTIFIWKKV